MAPGRDTKKMRIDWTSGCLRLALLLPFVFCLSTVSSSSFAQADFPAFKMSEFEGARNSRDAFSEEDAPEEIDVPRVSRRVYGGEDLNKLPVTGIAIQALKPYPELGITQDAIQAEIDGWYQAEQDIVRDDNGFTARDLREIGSFLRNLYDRGGEDQDDLDALMLLMEEQQFKSGWITIEQLDGIASKLTEYYRSRGFILATAFVPEQEVTDGIIELKVLEGTLGSVTVSNNKVFSDEVISSAFNPEIGEPVTEEKIESALRRINDLPGIRVRGSFSPGESVGETNLNLGVLEEKKWSANVLMDNHGSETTGEIRVFATAELLNIRNKGHRLLVGALRSEGPNSATYGLIEYELPVTSDGRGSVRGNISKNSFSVSGLPNLPVIDGETDSFAVMGDYQLQRSRSKNLSFQAGYTYKDVIFQVGDLVSLSSDQQIEVASVSAEYSRLWDEQQLLFTGGLGFDQGHVIEGQDTNQSTDFTKSLLNINLLKRFSVFNWITKKESYFNFVAKLNVQYSEKFLSSVEQFSLGGPNAVRAFSISDVSVDSGGYAGFELFFDLPVDPMSRFNLPFDPLRPFVFFDYAYGVARSADGSNNRDTELKAYGLGMRLNWSGRGTLNLIFAKPLSEHYDDDTELQGRSRVFLDLLYQLR